jgi:phosphoenolpyruvate carboxykinase (ATP)
LDRPHAFRLRPETEPEIYAATQMFGTVLENVVLDPATHAVDFDADKLTENTRACYPIHYIPNFQPSGAGGHPKNIVFLTADAFGVMPPISRLTADQAMYHFLSGYTAKVAGTERGVTEPSATFSACFGAPFANAPRRTPDAGRADRAARGERLAGEHRLDRRPTASARGRSRPIARDGPPRSRALDQRSSRRIRCSASSVPTSVPDVPPEPVPRRPGPIRAAYDAQARKLCRCSGELRAVSPGVSGPWPRGNRSCPVARRRRGGRGHEHRPATYDA